MTRIRSLCIYCGSRSGNDPALYTMVQDFGHILAGQGITLVYGGGSIGLMGILARAVLEHGGQAVGVIPRHLDQVEIIQKGLTELHIVEDMHSRRRKMFDLSDAFVSLPGSIGTLDETIEVITWRQLSLHDKPILLVNANNFWQPFFSLLRHIQKQGFAAPSLTDLFQVVDSIHDVLPALNRTPEPELAAKNRLF